MLNPVKISNEPNIKTNILSLCFVSLIKVSGQVACTRSLYKTKKNYKVMHKIKDFTPRLYQQTILNTSVRANTLICLPTGRGKTKTALLIALHRLNNFPESKVIFLTPTKPLAVQIAQEFQANSTLSNVYTFTGEMKPEDREKLFKEAQVVVSTPQGMSNDIINKKIDLRSVSAIIFDEAQHALGDYDYVWIAKQYQRISLYPRIIGLSASPGSDLEKISEVCQNLFIEDIEVRSDDDPDMKPYVQKTIVEYLLLDLPPDFKEVKEYLKICYRQKMKLLKELKLISSLQELSKTQLLQLQKEMQRRLAEGERDSEVWKGVSLIAESMKIQFTQELFETQGVDAAFDYMQRLYKEADITKVKATKNLVIDPNFKSAFFKISKLHDNHVEHPKFTRLLAIVEEEVKKYEKIMIFNNFRDSASKLKDSLNKIKGVSCELFVGQAKKKGLGLSQKQQIKMLDDFKEGKFNVLIGTSVGEEGIDIPSVDLIIFYEPVPSAIRTVQRRGRTGRMEKGKVIVLVTKGTRDESYRWAAHHKENRMHRVLKDLKSKFALQRQPKEQSLEGFNKKLKIYADSREKSSGVIKYLVDQGIDVRMQNLDVGDFLVSEKVGVERKEIRDFVDSILDKRLFHQVKGLKETFEKPLLIIEGMEDIYSVRKVHPNAIRGMLAWIAIDMKVPIIYTKDYRDTAELLITFARREQEGKDVEFGIRGEKKPLSTKELQEYIVAGLPGVGAQLAQSLLRTFKTITKVVTASEEELQEVDKIGKKKALEIKKILEEEYKE